MNLFFLQTRTVNGKTYLEVPSFLLDGKKNPKDSNVNANDEAEKEINELIERCLSSNKCGATSININDVLKDLQP